MEIIRKSTINLTESNKNKQLRIEQFVAEYIRIVNRYIAILWQHQIFYGSFLDKIIHQNVKTDLTACAQQSAGYMAFQIVKSQRKRKKKTMPVFQKQSIELDQRLIKIQRGANSFDLWIQLQGQTGGKKNILFLPSKKHRHYNKYLNQCWTIKKSAKLRIKDSKILLDVYFVKNVKQKTVGKAVGLDTGIKKLAVLSTGQVIGKELEQKMEKIARKKQGSKAFGRALIERDEYINREIKKIDLADLMAVVVENLKNLHHGKKKFRKQFRNKFQRWTYSYFLNRLQQFCEVGGVHCHRVDPAYTSQQCSECKAVHKESRNGEMFKCVSCGHTVDADFNASLNILQRFNRAEHLMTLCTESPEGLR